MVLFNETNKNYHLIYLILHMYILKNEKHKNFKTKSTKIAFRLLRCKIVY